ncbi:MULTISPECIES: hypothetical protein [Nocardioides]|uniref:Alpha/beta hydrolase n=1 Tax=Nocardioides vastitatis TaxID=2568655 RepID=A0ABW0ZHZ3_9ACTN|nr:hypothetical protein [Nocardioides sp.]THI96112.1 hypothetical protein E7Z54_17550 [Nocardioides sp.]
MSTQQAPGLQVSVHGHPNADTLLLWHPLVRTDPEAVAALATRIAGRGGFRVVVPHWADGRDLLRSVRYARTSTVHPPDALSVVGYGEAGVAALSLALHQRRLGIGLARVTCVDAVPGTSDPISGQQLPEPPASPAESVATAVDLIAGADEAAAEWARHTVDDWQAAGWAATLVPADQFTWRL